jgi:hypothetical protein
MQARHLLTLFLVPLALSAHAAETFYLRTSDLLQSERAQKFLDPAVKLYWGDEVAHALQEAACSYHNEQFTPNATDIECELDKKTASVTLRAFMANRK